MTEFKYQHSDTEKINYLQLLCRKYASNNLNGLVNSLYPFICCYFHLNSDVITFGMSEGKEWDNQWNLKNSHFFATCDDDDDGDGNRLDENS